MMRNGWCRWRQAGAMMWLAVLAGLIGVAGLFPHTAQAKGLFSPPSTQTVAIAQLPPEGQNMLALIYRGGPFTHGKDGAMFGNRERILPASARGYYREYTVRTPGERSRGARRIVCGGLQAAAPEGCFYTDDHYASFRKIVP
jgi:ribonuclease T1